MPSAANPRPIGKTGTHLPATVTGGPVCQCKLITTGTASSNFISGRSTTLIWRYPGNPGVRPAKLSLPLITRRRHRKSVIMSFGAPVPFRCVAKSIPEFGYPRKERTGARYLHLLPREPVYTGEGKVCKLGVRHNLLNATASSLPPEIVMPASIVTGFVYEAELRTTPAVLFWLIVVIDPSPATASARRGGDEKGRHRCQDL